MKAVVYIPAGRTAPVVRELGRFQKEYPNYRESFAGTLVMVVAGTVEKINELLQLSR